METAAIDKKRNRLAYLALYYAIKGDEERSERVRRLIWRMEGRAAMSEASAYGRPVVV